MKTVRNENVKALDSYVMGACLSHPSESVVVDGVEAFAGGSNSFIDFSTGSLLPKVRCAESSHSRGRRRCRGRQASKALDSQGPRAFSLTCTVNRDEWTRLIGRLHRWEARRWTRRLVRPRLRRAL